MAIEDAIADLGLPEPQPEGFSIQDLSAANWAMRKLARIRAQQKAVHEAACAEIDRLEAWDAAEQHRLDGEAAFFVDHLTAYHRRLIDEDPKAKTIRLAHGELRCRAQQPEFVRDDAALLAWAMQVDAAALVVTKLSPRWDAIKKRGAVEGDKLLDPATGEVIPGVTVIPREPKFTVEVEV